MKEVVRKEMVKHLEAGMIYPILDSSWKSPIQVVPKKGGITVIRNEKMNLFLLGLLLAGECALIIGSLIKPQGRITSPYPLWIKCLKD